MSFLSRLLGKSESRQGVRPLWHRCVAIAREKEWYRDCGVADTTEGRFEMMTMVLAMVLLRMESEPELAAQAALLTELFIEDMDGQLRESGVGDLAVGKHIGKLMGVLGGRLGALRAASTQDEAVFAAMVARNVCLRVGCSADAAALRLRELERQLAGLVAAELLKAEFSR